MTSRPAGGYGVGPDEVIRVAGAYQTQGDGLIELAKMLADSTVAAGQVGRHFPAVARRYQAALDALGKNLVDFGNRALEVNTRLRDVAGEYQNQEHANRAEARVIHG